MIIIKIFIASCIGTLVLWLVLAWIFGLIEEHKQKNYVKPQHEIWFDEFMDRFNNPEKYNVIEKPSLIKIARTEYPAKLDDYIGHKDVIKELKILIENYHKYGRVPNHMLFEGNAGLGKTTLSEIIANEIGAGYVSAIGEEVQEIQDINKLLEMIEEGTILFIDESHNVNLRVAEYLYSVLQDFKLTTGTEVKQFPRFTFIGATTNAELLPDPFLQRIVYRFHLDRYSESEIVKILDYCLPFEINSITDEAKRIIAKISQGVVRKARNEFLTAGVNLAINKEKSIIDEDIIRKVIQMRKIDEKTGLDHLQVQVLQALKDQVPIGEKNLAFKIGVVKNKLTDHLEPYLIKENYINRTPRGRLISEKGIKTLRRLGV